MGSLLNWCVNHKTVLLGAVAIVSGLVSMATANGDNNQVNSGWTQVIGGFGMIFLHGNIKRAEKKTEAIHNTLCERRNSPVP